MRSRPSPPSRPASRPAVRPPRTVARPRPVPLPTARVAAATRSPARGGFADAGGLEHWLDASHALDRIPPG